MRLVLEDHPGTSGHGWNAVQCIMSLLTRSTRSPRVILQRDSRMGGEERNTGLVNPEYGSLPVSRATSFSYASGMRANRNKLLGDAGWVGRNFHSSSSLGGCKLMRKRLQECRRFPGVK